MHTLTRRTFIIAVMLAAFVVAQAQTAIPKAPTASVTGRVTIGEKAAAGIVVAAEVPYDSPQRSNSPAQRAVTDADGRYRIANLPAGRYTITPLAPSFVVPRESSYGQPGKPLNLNDGEGVDGIDFVLTRGAVITGRVVEAEGRGVIGERVHLILIDDANKQSNREYYLGQFISETDDRGVYRLYGLPAGRYKVSVGENGDDRRGIGDERGYYTRTFYPNVTDAAKAEIVEVADGGEATGVDITLGKREQTFFANGKIVDAESGKAVATNNLLTFGALLKDETRFSMVTSMDGQVNARGEFQIPGLSPGRYAVYANAEGESDFFSEPVIFEITDADVSGIVIKLRRGASLSGIVVVEGTNDRSVLTKLAQLRIGLNVSVPSKMEIPTPKSTIVAADGSFRVNGLRAGKAHLYSDLFGSSNAESKNGLSLLRIERDGVEQPRDGIEIGEGEQVSGIRIILARGTGIVRGQVKIEGGTLPTNAHLYIQMRRKGTSAGREQYYPLTQLDARGRFVFENLIAGEYQVTLLPTYEGPRARRSEPVTQTVIVNDSIEAEVTLVVNLNPENQERQP